MKKVHLLLIVFGFTTISAIAINSWQENAKVKEPPKNATPKVLNDRRTNKKDSAQHKTKLPPPVNPNK